MDCSAKMNLRGDKTRLLSVYLRAAALRLIQSLTTQPKPGWTTPCGYVQPLNMFLGLSCSLNTKGNSKILCKAILRKMVSWKKA